MHTTTDPALRSHYTHLPAAALQAADDAVAHFANQYVDQPEADEFWLDVLQGEVLIGALLDRLPGIDGAVIHRGPGASIGESAVFVQRRDDLNQAGIESPASGAGEPACDTHLEIAPFLGAVFEWNDLDDRGRMWRRATGIAVNGNTPVDGQTWLDQPDTLNSVVTTLATLARAFVARDVMAATNIGGLQINTDAELLSA